MLLRGPNHLLLVLVDSLQDSYNDYRRPTYGCCQLARRSSRSTDSLAPLSTGQWLQAPAKATGPCSHRVIGKDWCCHAATALIQ
ncbi:hypothetical protein BASA50_002296 [Batrachochytrium salamandrivorans]|uniref:Uncharacterized protein n=1 Tax=Batrachochytrium salamandrivorans TaxID=1357716 RepID=A0ABQ8FLS8_9FUNG|nr:hypothetical protein BASA60_009971 [Batrachochytrium salamandrivorans]KAH6600474.1 hypothetical protein BASA50_002296 [Batrachochytrium salamandrivorans]